MQSLREKLLQTFKNLKSDAVPHHPKPEDSPENDIPENITIEEESESETENLKKDKPKKKPFFASKDKKKKGKFGKDLSDSIINTQATGNVINIVNSEDVHFGSKLVYNIGTQNTKRQTSNVDEEEVKKTNDIMLLMESTITPEYVHLDYISKNLGKEWHSFFRVLGYSKGFIETTEIDEAKNGVSEARYKLLLDWVHNDDDGTLGLLSTKLWDHGERQVVKELAILYKNRKQK